MAINLPAFTYASAASYRKRGGGGTNAEVAGEASDTIAGAPILDFGTTPPSVLTDPNAPSPVATQEQVSAPGDIATAPVLGPLETDTVTTPGSGLVFNITFDASVSSAPSGFIPGVEAVARYLEGEFSDPITINIAVGYGEINGQALLPNALGESQAELGLTTYSAVRSVLTADAKSADDATAVASLGASDPTNGGYFLVPSAEAKAMGFTVTNPPTEDGFVGFDSTANIFAYNNPLYSVDEA